MQDRNIFDDLFLFSECIIGFNFGLGMHEMYEMLATVFWAFVFSRG